uniref:Uncharacterized protein DKFZp459M0519 n=1 Tax=Pongo abelii TaxID=9601 RepID=Q5R6A0_PONAB|nr:hypothetical protein [Pongo abelii]
MIWKIFFTTKDLFHNDKLSFTFAFVYKIFRNDILMFLQCKQDNGLQNLLYTKLFKNSSVTQKQGITSLYFPIVFKVFSLICLKLLILAFFWAIYVILFEENVLYNVFPSLNRESPNSVVLVMCVGYIQICHLCKGLEYTWIFGICGLGGWSRNQYPMDTKGQLYLFTFIVIASFLWKLYRNENIHVKKIKH